MKKGLKFILGIVAVLVLLPYIVVNAETKTEELVKSLEEGGKTLQK